MVYEVHYEDGLCFVVAEDEVEAGGKASRFSNSRVTHCFPVPYGVTVPLYRRLKWVEQEDGF